MVSVLIQFLKSLYAQLQQNRIAFFFLKSVVVFVILKYSFLAFIGAMDAGGLLYFPILEKYDIIQVVRYSYINPTNWIVRSLGYPSYAYKLGVTILGPGGVQINNSCLAIETMIVFFTLISCYPSTRNKLVHLLIGLSCIYLLNLLRIVIVCISTTHSIRVADLNHTIFNLVVYAFIIIYFFFWSKEKAVALH